jgi:hypothetical protein
MGILGLLAEIYSLPNLKMNLKFDIEVIWFDGLSGVLMFGLITLPGSVLRKKGEREPMFLILVSGDLHV